MRKIVVSAFVSLDSVMQSPGRPDEDPSGGFEHGGWVAGHWEDEIGGALEETFSTPFDLLLGRRTYDIFAAFWPRFASDPAADEGNATMSRRFNQATKYVATHRPEGLTWENSRALGDDAVAALRALVREDGPMLLTQGSSALIQTLLAEDLVDELRLVVFPITLGRGKRLFGDGARPARFRVARSRVTAGGVLIATYERAGAVETGAFAS